MPVSADIENTNASVHGLHGMQGIKAMASRSALGDSVRRKPLGTVNYQNSKASTSLMAKQQIPEKTTQTTKQTATVKQFSLNTANSEPSVLPKTKELSCPLAEHIEEDKELMITAPEMDDDDFSDLWPICEQPVTYLKEFMAWRPLISMPVSSPVASPPVSPPVSDCDDEFFLSQLHDRATDLDLLSLSIPSFEEDLEYLSSLQ